jgi:hypothetical protein
MPELGSLVIAAIVAVAQGPAAKQPDRLRDIAADISAATARHERPLFDGEGGRLATALMLVAIAKHESEFHANVDDCSRRGDIGRSITIFQLLRGPNWGGHEARTICDDRRLAAKLALDLLSRPRLNKSRMTPQMLVNAYATGSPGTSNVAARDICKLWAKLAQNAGLQGAVCGAWRSFAAPRAPATR